jgi:hypothetical protein
MDLLSFVLVLVAVGVILWAVNTHIPMDPKIRQVLNIAVVVGTVLWVLQVFGLISSLHGIRIGR